MSSVAELYLPDNARGLERLRVYDVITEGTYYRGIEIMMLKDETTTPEGWGIYLCQIAHHIADEIALTGSEEDRILTLHAIIMSFADRQGLMVKPSGGL